MSPVEPRSGLGALCVAVLVLAGACGSDQPRFESVALPGDTYETAGPYLIEAYVRAPAGSKELVARLFAAPEAPTYRELAGGRLRKEEDVELWSVELPGRPAGTVFYYYLSFVDRHGKKIVYPPEATQRDAPEATLSADQLASFLVLPRSS